VGIKTTADSVFIRDDWGTLPSAIRPEPKLLHPLLTHHVASKWRTALPTGMRQVLYPQTNRGKRMVAIDLDSYPRARAYLELHRERLAGRAYIVRAGRAWYEIWVTQNPADWAQPKLVLPDIAERPRCFVDMSGAIVNGDCYWITTRDAFHKPTFLMMLAVANSSFAVKFYDAVCGNQLYEGRRRFMSQYIRRFPLPELSSAKARRALDMTEELVSGTITAEAARERTERELDALMWKLFAVTK
jgi:hypothetical protein